MNPRQEPSCFGAHAYLEAFAFLINSPGFALESNPKHLKNMALTAEDKAAVIRTHQRDQGDTGSPEVQIALMTARIQDLTGHFKTHIHDHHSRRGLLRLVNQRRKMLNYLRNTDLERYRALIKKLGLRK